MKNIVATIGSGIAGGAAGRKLGAWEVAQYFPGFHDTHGYNHEIFGALLGTAIGALAGNTLYNLRNKNRMTNSV